MFIPKNIEIKNSQYTSKGLGVSCEIATFSIPQYPSNKINEFNSHLEIRKVRNLVYSEWKKSPYKLTGNGLEITDRWLNGIVCSKIDEVYKQEIIKGLESSGSFYTKASYDNLYVGLILIPKMNLLVFSFSN